MMKDNNENYPVLVWLCIVTSVLLIAGYLCSCQGSKTVTQPPMVKLMNVQITSDDEKRDAVSGFVIERSRDGITWVIIDSIPATGKAFYNKQIPEVAGLYRLKINKLSGANYKKIINVK